MKNRTTASDMVYRFLRRLPVIVGLLILMTGLILSISTTVLAMDCAERTMPTAIRTGSTSTACLPPNRFRSTPNKQMQHAWASSG